MHRIVLLTALVVGAATPLLTIIASTVAAYRATRQRPAVVLRMAAGLAVWAAVSAFALFVTFVNVYSVSHTDYAYRHGRANPDDVTRVDNFLTAVHAIYVIACGLMAYYYLRLAKGAGEHRGGGGEI